MVPLYPFKMGVKANLSDVVKGTLEHLTDEVILKISPTKQPVPLEALFVYGFDGSG